MAAKCKIFVTVTDHFIGIRIVYIYTHINSFKT